MSDDRPVVPPEIDKELEDFAQAHRIQAKLDSARDDAERRHDITELKRLLSAESHRQDALAVIAEAVPLVNVPKLRPFKKTLRESAPAHTWGLVISDWQLGQKTSFADTGHLFEQTSEITKTQVRALWDLVAYLHTIYVSSLKIEELVIFSLGDLVEGDSMRVSQAAMVDSLVTKQAMEVFDLEAELIYNALALFPKVRVLHVGGNHDRLGGKGGQAGLGELGYTDTFAWVIGGMLQRMFKPAIEEGRLEIVNHESFFGTAIVAGQRCVYEHGASFRSSTGSYGGVSYYSIANAAAGYQRMLDGADLVLMGHHHKAMLLPMGRGWQVMNGCLPPSSQFIQSNFKGIVRPTQVLLDIHHEHGLVGFKPLYIESPNMIKPGKFWEPALAAAP